MRAVVHIGPHKTGTTHLQQVFRGLRHPGIVFPAAWGLADDQPSHKRLADALAAGTPVRADFAEPTLLISAEDLNLLEPNSIQALRDLLQGRDTTIVFYARRWSEVLPSVWQERVKHGFTETLPQFVNAVLAHPERAPFADFTPILDRYAAAFGKSAIRVVCYNEVADIARHFFQTFLPDADASDIGDARPNQSLPSEQTEMIRVLNMIHQQNGGARGPELREWFLRAAPQHDLTPIQTAIAAHQGTLPLSDEDPRLAAIHQRAWTTYGSQAVPPHPASGFFTPANRTLPFANTAYLGDPTVQQRYLSLYNAFRSA